MGSFVWWMSARRTARIGVQSRRSVRCPSSNPARNHPSSHPTHQPTQLSNHPTEPGGAWWFLESAFQRGRHVGELLPMIEFVTLDIRILDCSNVIMNCCVLSINLLSLSAIFSISADDRQHDRSGSR
uniref:(northern house mosquito) hypothetical protein n=1 Tax=Culex pipiens TaxID=7175 RepID=A0A8D8BAD0_CULPI